MEAGELLAGVTVNAKEIVEIQGRYSHLVNYVDRDPCAPIDPMSYIDSNGDHLLHIAARLGDTRTIALLLDSGQKVDEIGDMGSTALHYAYAGEQEEAVKLLLSHGADTFIRDGFGRLPDECRPVK
jgi:ankyrin repeat protein